MESPAAAQAALQTSLDYHVEANAYNNSVRAAAGSAIRYPRLAIDRDPASPRYGAIYVVGLEASANPCANVAVVRSFDGGRSFDNPHIAPPCLTGLTLDVIAASNGALFAAAWGPRFLRSMDGGRSWELLAELGNASSPASLWQDSATRALHLAWTPAPQGVFGPILTSSSSDGGRSWTASIPALSAGVESKSPQIAAFAHSVVLAGILAPKGSDPFVGVLHSIDGGTSWSNVSALTGTAPCLRYSAPSATVSRTGVFAVSWYEDPSIRTTDCWGSWGNGTRTFVSVSLDGGRSFGAARLAGGPPGWPTVGYGDAIGFDDAGRLYVTWHSIAFNWASASVYVANSTGPEARFEPASFTTNLQVGGGNSTAQENLAAGPNNTVYLLWVAVMAPSGDPNGRGIFVRAVAGEAAGDVSLTSSLSTSLAVEIRDAGTGAVAFRGTWTGAPLALADAPPATYTVRVTVGNDSSLSGQMPIRTWSRTSFTIHVKTGGGTAFPWAIAVGAGLAVATGAASLLAVQHTRITRKAVLQREVRGLMYGFIRDHPGASFSEVRDALGLQNGVTSYHLSVLERQGLLHSESRRRHRWYFPEGDVTAWQNLPLSALQASLIDQVRRQPGIGVRELARALNRRASSVAYNVKALAREGVLRTEQTGRKVRCYPMDRTSSA
jgi:DNA-binding MarR family transcriptional regulator